MRRFLLCLNYMMFPLVLWPLLILDSVLLYLRSPKGGCCLISDDLSCSYLEYQNFNHVINIKSFDFPTRYKTIL